jgi:hypothetical protein
MGQKGICIVGALPAGADDPHGDLFRRGFAGCGATGNKMRHNKGRAAGDKKTPPADGMSNYGSDH